VTDDAIYWLNDMYGYGQGNPKYMKLRVIKKQDILNTYPGPINWQDLWDLRNPNAPGATTRTAKLVHNLDNSGSVYLIGLPNPSGATYNFLFLYKVRDDYDNLSMTSSSVSCSNYSMPPHMIHLGGGKPMQLWWFFYSEQVQRNGKIYAAHSSRNSGGTADIHYMEIDTASFTVTSEIFLNNPGYYYGYPDIMVDNEDNVFMVYNRTSAAEYPGVFYTAKPNGADIFLDDMLLKAGEGDFNIPCGNTSNPFIRFEDYTDIMFDPVDSTTLWIMGEYIGADNKWKSRVGKISTESTIGISTIGSSIPSEYMLKQNYPNPFNPATRIEFIVPQKGNVNLIIYDIMGREVALLVNSVLESGSYEYNFNAVNIAAGVYFYRLETNEFIETKKMILVK
jgi:hypothetical protein